MEKPTSRVVTVVAILQFIPPLILPPSMFASLNLGLILVLAGVLAVFGLLAWGLLTYRSWARVLTTFVQGLNATIRLLTLFPHAVKSNGQVDVAFIVTGVLSIGFSIALLYSIDKPDIVVMFES
ncbi:MAG: hypothetical protein NUW24_01875 [Anaerolineae bacterium]|jgi:predicted MFS family arabinose efflux permease|nr:hypothetical protein [Anaerolineae bacterium]MDH7473150.1 hypothetical protein [Anaerolineae bacterium]